MSHIQQITLDLIPNGEMPILYASQYDAGRSFRANIVERKIPYNLDGTELISLTVRKGDGNLVTMDIANTFANKSYIDFLSTEQMTAIAGSNFGELHLESNGESIGTLNFYLLVEPAADEGGVSESEINNLNRQITEEVDRILPDMVDEVAEPIINEKVPEKVAELVPQAVATEVGEIVPPLVNELVPQAVGDNYYNKTQTDSLLNTKAPASDLTAVSNKVIKLENTALPLLTTKDFSEAGYIRASDGLFLSAPNNFTTPYIPVVAGDKFYIKSFVDNNRAQIAYYTDTSGHGYQAIATGNLTYKETEYTVANNGYVRFSMSYPEYYPLIFYYAGDLSKSFTSYIDKETSETASKVDTLDDSIYGKKKITFEIGNITISNSGWVYSDNTKRIRTPNGYTIHLRVGDKIKVTSNTVRIYIGWLADIDNHYYSYGWLQGVGEYSVVSDGKFVMTASLVPEAVLSSVEQVSDYIEVYQARNVDSSVFLMNPNSSVRGVNHKGYCFIAPEDTMPAYKLSKKMGFEFVETDVSFTSDNIPVLLHDNTINRTARNADGSEIATTINISDITFSQSQAYDFGIWKSPVYAGTKIPKFEDFIKYCKYAGLKPYVEIKTSNITEAKVRIICDLVTKYGMDDFVTFISFSSVALGWVASYRPKARLGLLTATIDATVIGYAHDLENGTNEVFFDIDKSAATDANIETLTGEGFAVEVYIIDMLADLQALNPAITGVTTNSLNVPLLLYQYSETL